MEEDKQRTLELLGYGNCSDERQQEIMTIFENSVGKKFKRGTSFSKVTQAVITEKLGLKVLLDWTAPYKECPISTWVTEGFEIAKKGWKVTTEQAARAIINLILFNVLIYTDSCQIWCEVPIDAGKVYGNVDYVVAKRTTLPEPKLPYVVILEAKLYWAPQSDQFQLMAEMYACLMNNKNDKSVYGALTNADHWQFFKLDTDLSVYCSEVYTWKSDMPQIFGILLAMFTSQDEVEVESEAITNV